MSYYGIEVGNTFNNLTTLNGNHKNYMITITKVTTKYITYNLLNTQGQLVKSNIRSWVYNNEDSMYVGYRINHMGYLCILKKY